MSPETIPSPDLPPPIDASPDLAYRFALANPLVPKVYGNQFFIVVQPGDIGMMIGHSGNPAGIVSMSYSLAKSLAARLQEAIAGYEKNIGASVTLVESLEAKFREATEATKS